MFLSSAGEGPWPACRRTSATTGLRLLRAMRVNCRTLLPQTSAMTSSHPVSRPNHLYSFLMGMVAGAVALFLSLQATGKLARPHATPEGAPPPEVRRSVSSKRSEEPVTTEVIKSTPLERSEATLPPPPAILPLDPMVALDQNSVVIPVAGMAKSSLRDNFNDIRGGGRRHEALDIMAARGTPVLAAVDGKVRKLFLSAAGGITIYEADQSGQIIYYYAHLDSYVANLKEGQALTKGDVIGYVGTTGNAAPNAPHLHFAVMQLPPTKEWWKGTPINPYPLLAQRGVTYRIDH